MQRIIRESHDEAKRLLRQHRPQLDALVRKRGAGRQRPLGGSAAWLRHGGAGLYVPLTVGTG